MEHSQNKNILLIVEGGKTEKVFFNRIKEVFGLDAHIVSAEVNIYALYRKLVECDFQADLRDILYEMRILNRETADINFTYTYLVYDADVQHRELNQKQNPIEDVVRLNLSNLLKLSKHFTNETDPSIGKLYINYPMMEAYRDCADFFDCDYENTVVTLEQIPAYKSIVGKRRLASMHINNYCYEHFIKLARMSVYKIKKIVFGVWGKLDYNSYRQVCDDNQIICKQKAEIELHNLMYVLNTSVLFFVDYYGNRDGFFDKIVTNSTMNCN